MKRIEEQEDFSIELKDDPPAILKEGIYEVIYFKHEANRRYFSQKKIYIYFKIISTDENNGVEVYRAYNQYDVVKRNSDFIKDCEIILGRRLRKKEKASTAIFKNKVLRVRVRTVKNNRKQERLPDFMQYPVIDAIQGVVAGETKI